MEAFSRPFIGIPDAVRADLMRRIRTECPDSGLRDVFEHLWLRGLLSGAIGADQNSKANAKPAKKETPKAILNKLVTALDAGQRVVKRLIQAKWDGGRYVAGMAGCARTWPTQMMQFETTPRVQQYFSTRYKLRFICTSNHATETIHPNSCFETAIQRHDLALAQAYIQSDADNPSFHGVEGDIMLKDAYCPLTLKLGPEVEYELVSRVLYHPTDSTAPTAVGYYTTQTRIGNRRSRSNTRAELDADSAKVPALPPPSLVPDSNEQEPWIRKFYADPTRTRRKMLSRG
ncbi:hypothetical protein B0H13DRAFT_1909260 [Mycena leptocephala]|nr:hypothetical protein B0H13DRAFT_1909260 [Mycena leptocephala]